MTEVKIDKTFVLILLGVITLVVVGIIGFNYTQAIKEKNEIEREKNYELMQIERTKLEQQKEIEQSKIEANRRATESTLQIEQDKLNQQRLESEQENLLKFEKQCESEYSTTYKQCGGYLGTDILSSICVGDAQCYQKVALCKMNYDCIKKIVPKLPDCVCIRDGKDITWCASINKIDWVDNCVGLKKLGL